MNMKIAEKEYKANAIQGWLFLSICINLIVFTFFFLDIYFKWGGRFEHWIFETLRGAKQIDLKVIGILVQHIRFNIDFVVTQ